MNSEVEHTQGKMVEAVFWFQIPFGESDGKDILAEQETPPPRSDQPIHQLHLLMAEDNNVNAKVLGLMLDKIGHSYVRVKMAKEAYEASTQQHFDAILMDMQMPEMDGIGSYQANTRT